MPQERRGPVLCLLLVPPPAPPTRQARNSPRCHVWTAPVGQGEFSGVGEWSGAVMYPACWCGLLTAGPDGLRGSGSKHRGALLRRDDRTECPDPGPDHFAVAAWCSLRLSGRMARRGVGIAGFSLAIPGSSPGTTSRFPVDRRCFLVRPSPVSSSRPERHRAPRAGAVKPLPPEAARSGLDGASTALDWLGRGGYRLAVARTGGEHGPGDAGGLGGLRQHRDLDRTAGEDAALPRGGAIGAWR